jgi:16S rRNA C1402 (ribose-2'-O) methylase RsmI
MTKIHEEFLREAPQEVLESLKERGEARGEFAVLVAGRELA